MENRGSGRSSSYQALSDEPPSAKRSRPSGLLTLEVPVPSVFPTQRRRTQPVAARFKSLPSRINSALRPDYFRAIQEWTARLLDVQRPIRVLEAVRWRDDVQFDFFTRHCRELPRIGRDDYRRQTSDFDIRQKQNQLRSLERDILGRLGGENPASRLLLRRCRSNRDALRLIAARGTAEFAVASREIYGSSLENSTGLVRLIEFFEKALPAPESECVSAFGAAQELTRRLGTYFVDVPIDVRIAEHLASDACAGSTYLKLRRDATFSKDDIRLLEVHEGWAHLGTAFNGSRQPLFALLGKASPGTTRTQEGLAVLTELLTGACHSQRRRRLARRLRAVAIAEEGADFLQVYRYLLECGCNEIDSYRQAARVFRGSLPTGVGPFTKDLSYGLGLISLVDRLRALPENDRTTIPLLFSGKTSEEDLPDLAELHEAGVLIPGEFIPAAFRDGAVLRDGLRELG